MEHRGATDGTNDTTTLTQQRSSCDAEKEAVHIRMDALAGLLTRIVVSQRQSLESGYSRATPWTPHILLPHPSLPSPVTSTSLPPHKPLASLKRAIEQIRALPPVCPYCGSDPVPGPTFHQRCTNHRCRRKWCRGCGHARHETLCRYCDYQREGQWMIAHCPTCWDACIVSYGIHNIKALCAPGLWSLFARTYPELLHGWNEEDNPVDNNPHFQQYIPLCFSASSNHVKSSVWKQKLHRIIIKLRRGISAYARWTQKERQGPHHQQKNSLEGAPAEFNLTQGYVNVCRDGYVDSKTSSSTPSNESL